jgi:ATP-dependent RNA helicase SUPV3L1/SUV3
VRLDMAGQGRIIALLGPTNTGKTHAAIERMLQLGSGMIGLPLRLLAREVYERLVAVRGTSQVALVTGEEKRVPPSPRFWVCTVESMPVDRPVAFLAVDEVQLAGDRHRGHVFTDRLLRARGVGETWLLGSDTAAPLLQSLVPTVELRRQPRLSTLRSAGHRKLQGLPPRSAIVAFSAEKVFAIAERVRARHGGAAVVLGALSPRARNAQVGLFESGDVQHLVATDAIGMGLNLDVHHVALAGTSKYDGLEHRPLRADELAQIAGRAGRYRRDGTFGTTDEAEPLSDELVTAIEQHELPVLKRMYWRRADLELGSVTELLASLDAPPPRRMLVPVRDADDARALRRLVEDAGVVQRARGAVAVRLLWDVCGVPDFGQVQPEHHATLLRQLYVRLVDEGGLSDAWMAAQVDRLDRVEGDASALMGRIAQLRVWSYVAWRPGWTGPGWTERLLEVEERLSVALHDRLTARFLDHRAGIVRPDVVAAPEAVEVGPTGRVSCGGREVGRILGLGFELRAEAPSRPLLQAIRAAVGPVLRARAEQVAGCPDAAIGVDPEGGVRWDGAVIGRLVAGERWQAPRLRVARLDELEAPARERVAQRLDRWLRAWLAEDEALLAALPSGSPASRALGHALRGGAAPVREVRALLDAVPRAERDAFLAAGVRVGPRYVVLPRLLERVGPRLVLWRVHTGEALEAPDDGGRLPFEADWTPAASRALGFLRVGRWLVRVDLVDALLAGGRRAGIGWGVEVGLVEGILEALG